MIEPNDFWWGFMLGSIATSVLHLIGRWCEHWLNRQDRDQ